MFRRDQKPWRSIAAIAVGALILLAGVPAIKPPEALAKAKGYDFTLVGTLGDQLPGPQGGTYIRDFEPSGLNNDGTIVFGADVSTGGEGVYLRSKGGGISEIIRVGENAPGGGVFDGGILGPTTLNDEGDVATNFGLSPFSFFPIGLNCGTFLFSHNTGALSAIVLPGKTPVPGGGKFAGVFFGPTINNRGHIVFPGIVATDQGIHIPTEDYVGFGIGLYLADKKGKISAVVSPGDPAPGGGRFDWAGGPPWLNDRGDVAFCAHIAGEECVAPEFPPQSILIGCLYSLYVKKASTGEILSIAHAGEPAPGGGTYRQAYSPVMNNRGDIVFVGDLTPAPNTNQVVGVFLNRGGMTIPVARPGDPMPGGGHFVTGSNILGIEQVHVNNPGEVAFNAILDTDVNGDGVPDTGLFVWSNGTLRLVARSGTVIPGVGTIAQLATAVTVIPEPLAFPSPNSGAITNDRGQVYFSATLTDGRGIHLVATPKP